MTPLLLALLIVVLFLGLGGYGHRAGWQPAAAWSPAAIVIILFVILYMTGHVR